MDKTLTRDMMIAVHSSQWEIFLQWVDAEEKQIIAENRRATPEGLVNLQGKLQFVERLRSLRGTVKRELELQKSPEDTPNG